MHDLAHERRRAMHEPRQIGGIAMRQHCELGGAVALEGREEMELDDDLRWRRSVQDFHPARADILVALPRIDRALAACRAAIAALHRRILVFVRRPGPPLMKVVDQRKNPFRRRLDNGGALDAERIWLGRGDDEDDRDRDCKHDGDDGNDLEHEKLRICELTATHVNGERVSTRASSCRAATARPTPSARDKNRTGYG